jgi:hypothetical protein
MRRALNIAFFLAAIAYGAFLWIRHADRAPAPTSKEAAPVGPRTTTPTPPPSLAPPPPRLAPASAAPEATDERTLMQQLRAVVKSDPVKAEALAREGRQRFPDGGEADERDALLVDALINQQRIGAARSETYYYFDHHPGGRFTEHLFTMTGVHPTPRGPVR